MRSPVHPQERHPHEVHSFLKGPQCDGVQAPFSTSRTAHRACDMADLGCGGTKPSTSECVKERGAGIDGGDLGTQTRDIRATLSHIRKSESMEFNK